MRYFLLVCIGGVLLSGCAAIEDYHYCYVNQRRAAAAWKSTCSRSERRAISADYECGWKEGYFDVSTGGCGEPPIIPPNRYWSPRFQNEAGQAAIQDWFAGFQDGATAAQSDGSGAFHRISTGPTVPTHDVAFDPHDVFVPPGHGEHSTTFSETPHFLHSMEPVMAWPPFSESTSEQVATNPEPALESKATPKSPEEVNIPPVITED